MLIVNLRVAISINLPPIEGEKPWEAVERAKMVVRQLPLPPGVAVQGMQSAGLVETQEEKDGSVDHGIL